MSYVFFLAFVNSPNIAFLAAEVQGDGGDADVPAGAEIDDQDPQSTLQDIDFDDGRLL